MTASGLYRHPRPPIEPRVDSSLMMQSSPAPVSQPSDDLPIAIRKGTRSTSNPHPVYNFFSFHRLSLPYLAFVSTLSSVSTPKSTSKALSHPSWKLAMVKEMDALYSNDTWDLVAIPLGKSPVGCRWVYTVKVGPDGQIDRLKTRLVAKGYTQQYGETIMIHFLQWLRLSLFAYFFLWLLCVHGLFFKLDIKNVFLHGDLADEVYMEKVPGFVAQGESSLVCKLRRSLYGLKQSPRAWFSRFSSVLQEFGMIQITTDHSVFYHHSFTGKCIYLIVYVDDIVITGTNLDGI